MPERSPRSEKERVWASYWTFFHGDLVPTWLCNMVETDVLWAYHDRIYGRRDHDSRWSTNWFHMGCAIELEHRARAVATPRELRRAAATVRAAGYDYTAAIELDDEVRVLIAQCGRESSLKVERWLADLPRRRLEATPAAIQLRREIEAKRLPQDAESNLALMRAILGIEK